MVLEQTLGWAWNHPIIVKWQGSPLHKGFSKVAPCLQYRRVHPVKRSISCRTSLSPGSTLCLKTVGGPSLVSRQSIIQGPLVVGTPPWLRCPRT